MYMDTMKIAAFKLSALYVFSVITVLETTVSVAWAESLCVRTKAKEPLDLFTLFYIEKTSPQFFQALNVTSEIIVFDCGYVYIFELRVKPGVFGVSESFFFRKEPFDFIGGVLIN